jgi:hypothetical protein
VIGTFLAGAAASGGIGCASSFSIQALVCRSSKKSKRMDGGLVTATVSLIEEVDSMLSQSESFSNGRKNYDSAEGWEESSGYNAVI